MSKRAAGRRAARRAAALGLFLFLAGAAIAGPLQDADRAYRSGNYAAAAKLAEQAVRENPNDPVGYQALGLSRRKLGDVAGAREAWDNVLRLDPSLRSIRDDAGFLRAYRQVGGDPNAARRQGASASGSQAARTRGSEEANQIIRALTDGDVYVHPDLQGEVDAAALAAAARSAGSTQVKVVAVPKLGPYPTRAAMADDLRTQLGLGDNAAVIVGTPKGISASAGRLSDKQVTSAVQSPEAARAFAQGGLGPALEVATRGIGRGVGDDRRGDANRAGTFALLGLAGVGGALAIYAGRKRREMDDARGPVLEMRNTALKDLSYVDGYLDLLPVGEEGDRAKRLRASAFERFATADALLKQAKRPEEVRQAEPLLRQAIDELEECRRDIDRATGGTGVAMSAPVIPDLDTDADRVRKFKTAEQIRTRDEAERLQREIDSIPEGERGVSFFSGQPMPKSQLVPVTMVIDGQKRTVMATREEAEAIRRGETPQVRAFDDGSGRYVPWYDNRRYDPYRDYYGGWGMGGFGGMGTFVNLFLLTQLFGGGMFGGYGYGFGAPVMHGGYGAGGFGGGFGGEAVPQYDPTPDNSGGFDFFGQGGYSEQSSDGGFGFGDDGGGGDFGGGDFGGGDFGGGDW